MTKMPRLYIAGPMTGLPDLNYPEFNQWARLLRSEGFEVVNPAETALPSSTAWTTFMRAGISGLVTCDAVAVLSDWEQSRGAFLEVTLAKSLEMPVRPVGTWFLTAMNFNDANHPEGTEFPNV